MKSVPVNISVNFCISRPTLPCSDSLSLSGLCLSVYSSVSVAVCLCMCVCLPLSLSPSACLSVSLSIAICVVELMMSQARHIP